MCLFYLYANAKIEIHICSNKHETGLVELESPLLHAKFQDHRTSGSGEEDF